MSQVPPLARLALKKQTPTSQSQAGAARVVLPLIQRVPLMGWGPFLKRYTRMAIEQEEGLPLHARALVIEDPYGERVALIGVDLHGGSRWVSERVAQQLAGEGFDIRNVFVCGTHNHAGPSGLYASRYYDGFGSSTSNWNELTEAADGRVAFNEVLAEDIARRIVDAVKVAASRLRPTIIGFADERLPRWNTNRSFEAFLRNFGKTASGGPSHAEVKAQLARAGLVASDDASSLNERHGVDDRVRCLVAVDASSTADLIGVFSTYGAHNAIQHRQHNVQSSDFFGHAALTLERSVGATQRTKFPPVFAFAAGSIGDADPLSPDLTREQFLFERQDRKAGLALIHQHGTALAGAVSAAVKKARSRAHSVERLAVAYSEERIASAVVKSGKLAPQARVGWGTVAGSELGTGMGSEGVRDDRRVYQSDPHAPKIYNPTGLTALPQDIALAKTRTALDAQHDRLPLRLLDLTFKEYPAPFRLLSLPGEPTTWLTHRLMLALKGNKPQLNTMVCAVTGDYAGYFTTALEYAEQAYEGSSTIWGRHTGEWLEVRAAELLEQLAGRRAPVLLATAIFNSDRETVTTTIDGDGGLFDSRP